jgi:hypothetical protein
MVVEKQHRRNRIFSPFFSLFALWLLAVNIYPMLQKDVLNRDLDTVSRPQTVYGPFPSLAPAPKPLNFYGVVSSFGKIPLERIKEIPYQDLESLILTSFPLILQKRLRPFLKSALLISESWQVDPFWVLSIMHTESHFNPKVNSIVNARGLMQIMPRTADFLVKIINKNYQLKSPRDLNRNNRMNIDLGVFYLNRLLKKYRYNYIYATVAYNMGPGNVRSMRMRGMAIGRSNRYLNKVKVVYDEIIQNFMLYLEKISSPYERTYVVKNQWRFGYFEKSFELLEQNMSADIRYIPLMEVAYLGQSNKKFKF